MAQSHGAALMATFKYLTDNDLSLKSIWAWARQLVKDLNTLSSAAGGSAATFDVGDIKETASDDIPAGWLLCDGGQYTVDNQPALFAKIGYKYGGADGVFNVPNYVDKLRMGAGSIVALGETAGATDVTLTVANLPAHSHTVNDPGHHHTATSTPHTHAVTDPGHNHAITDPGHNHGVADPGHVHANGAGAPTASGAAGGVSDVTTQGNTGSATTGITLTPSASNVTINNGTTGISNQNATVTVTIADAATGITTASVGGDAALTVLNPVIGVNVIIKA